MTENNFPILFHHMIYNFSDLHNRLNFVSNDKDNYKIFKQVEEVFEDLKSNIKNINNIIDTINNKFDDIYSGLGTINSCHPELFINSFTESQSDLSCSDNEDCNDLDSSTISFEKSTSKDSVNNVNMFS